MATDAIEIKALQLSNGIVAPDIWGTAKVQPAHANIRLNLRRPFASAASKDALDNSTIHYGQLAKGLRACADGSASVDEMVIRLTEVVASMGRKSSELFILASTAIEIVLPKASMDGNGMSLTTTHSYDDTGKVQDVRRCFTMSDVKIMTLVGVNASERTAKQPLIVTLSVDFGDDTKAKMTKSTDVLFSIERLLVDIIQATSFETLESLAEFTIKQLQDRILETLLPRSRIKLRIEKPRAIAFAEAPVIEIVRSTRASR